MVERRGDGEAHAGVRGGAGERLRLREREVLVVRRGGDLDRGTQPLCAGEGREAGDGGAERL